ncbi:hypothetical protein CTI12_AA029330 [Artemisia annua]|uniref:Uncharacterized protein n=1 Tax=Artemisia annua TaxID=35608 RepID=A0A2U1QHJ0_ARTAN|nr:hypothetical protein CTI12_AA029330 [Artemisia annua]
MFVDLYKPLYSYGSRAYQPANSLSADVSGGNSHAYDQTFASGFDGAINDVGSTSSVLLHSDVALRDADEGAQVRLPSEEHSHPVFVNSADGSSAAFVPVQISTVQGSVSTFRAVNVEPHLSDTHWQMAADEGSSTGAGTSRANEGTFVTRMDLDFSRGDQYVVLHIVFHAILFLLVRAYLVTQNYASGFPRTNTHPREIPPSGGRTRRPRAARRQVNRRHASAGPARGVDRAVSPVQGPIAPPQRQGRYLPFVYRTYLLDVSIVILFLIFNAFTFCISTGAPSDYKSFGRCDQVCQHCQAVFWLEEKRSRLPATARDKLRDADIPNFQIRLFGVAGSSQYELPTADTIGAIVYEGGPESMTDYDIVIERHSMEPESVNKLHPTLSFKSYAQEFGWLRHARRKEDDYEDVLCISVMR